MKRWWYIKAEGDRYGEWTDDPGKAEWARRNGYRVDGPHMLEPATARAI